MHITSLADINVYYDFLINLYSRLTEPAGLRDIWGRYALFTFSNVMY